MDIIAHRGASFYEPENTLRPIKKAMQMGADLVEVDVRQSRDGELVVMHDQKVDRTTDGKGYIKDMDLHELNLLLSCYDKKCPKPGLKHGNWSYICMSAYKILEASFRCQCPGDLPQTRICRLGHGEKCP